MPAVTLGITGPIFILTLNGKCLDRSVTTAVERACDMEFLKRLASRPTQGIIVRLKDVIFLKPEMIGRQCYIRRSLEGKTKTHTRAMYVDSTYRRAIIHTYIEQWRDISEPMDVMLKSATKSYKYLRCLCCVAILYQEDKTVPTTNTHNYTHLFHLQHGPNVNSGLYGNLRHYRFFCLNKIVCEVRHTMIQLLEDHLTSLLRIATKWGKTGFSTLLLRVMNGLITLDQQPYHNAITNDLTHRRTKSSHCACLTSDEWILLVESKNIPNSSLARANFVRWPLVHQFAFIPANSYTEPELKDGEYSPCDLISMGIIPSILQDIILQFAYELGAKHSQDTKKEFLLQWQRVRAVPLLRAISLAMTVGAQVAEYKNSLLNSHPSVPLQDDTLLIADLVSTSQKTKRKISLNSNCTFNCFVCIGITCSSTFTSLTNLRPSIMCKPSTICRRCRIMANAIIIASSIEATLATDINTLTTFMTAVTHQTNMTSDSIINAISKICPLPEPLTLQGLQRSTKRNVYPLVTVAAVRLLCGTFGWKMSEHPTSLDKVFNRVPTLDDSSASANTCTCTPIAFFSIQSENTCCICGDSSAHICTARRVKLLDIQQPTNDNDKPAPLSSKAPSKTSRITTKNRKARRTNAITISTPTKATTDPNHIPMRDITNIIHQRPISDPNGPNESDLQNITTPYHMLSNFVVSYVFSIAAKSYQNILYTDFLFELVKRDGGWTQFVNNSITEGHYAAFFEALKQTDKACIVPICHDHHWTVLIRKFNGNAWRIFFADSLSHGTDHRFSQWKALFNDDILFTGTWTKVKLTPQSELECGARACLHGICFALSHHNSSKITTNIARISNLAARSRTMVSSVCISGTWHSQGWLKSIIDPQIPQAGKSLP